MISSLKNTLRSGVGLAARLSPKIRALKTQGVAVFVFHDVSPTPSPFSERHNLSASPELFRQQVEWIGNTFNIIHPDQLLDEDIPGGSAVLTFDDGWAGTFSHAFPILEEMKVPAVVFLNMEPILKGTFLASAMADYLGTFDASFQDFARARSLPAPFHLSLTPELYEMYVEANGSAHLQMQCKDQGEMASVSDLEKWDGHDLFRYANHMYNHWNTAALTDLEVKNQYLSNQMSLKAYKSATPLFAYPNGQPGTCYREATSLSILEWGAQRLFSATGTINGTGGPAVLDRVALTAWHTSLARFWYSFGRSAFR